MWRIVCFLLPGIAGGFFSPLLPPFFLFFIFYFFLYVKLYCCCLGGVGYLLFVCVITIVCLSRELACFSGSALVCYFTFCCWRYCGFIVFRALVFCQVCGFSVLAGCTWFSHGWRELLIWPLLPFSLIILVADGWLARETFYCVLCIVLVLKCGLVFLVWEDFAEKRATNWCFFFSFFFFSFFFFSFSSFLFSFET